MESLFSLNGQSFVLTAEKVEAALRDVTPEGIWRHGVEIGGRLFPVTQALAVTLGLERKDCTSRTARRLLRRLDLKVVTFEGRTRREMARERLREALPYRSRQVGWVKDELLELEPILLEWFRWHRWVDLAEHGAAILELPFIFPGVYEARLKRDERRLTIGRAMSLGPRILYGLIRGSSRHPSGRKIRENEDVTKVLVRWAFTNRPAAAEEELHHRHFHKWGHLPKYTVRT